MAFQYLWEFLACLADFLCISKNLSSRLGQPGLNTRARYGFWSPRPAVGTIHDPLDILAMRRMPLGLAVNGTCLASDEFPPLTSADVGIRV